MKDNKEIAGHALVGVAAVLGIYAAALFKTRLSGSFAAGIVKAVGAWF